jgi:hypothetical protein
MVKVNLNHNFLNGMVEGSSEHHGQAKPESNDDWKT